MDESRTIKLSKTGAQKIRMGDVFLYEKDTNDSLKSFTPGQWCYLENEKNKQKYIGFINPLVNKDRPCLHIVCEFKKTQTAWQIIENCLERAFQKRQVFNGYETCSRLFYGNSDGLPGLIVDSYSNKVLLQVNLMGVENFREKIKKFYQEKFEDKDVIFLDNEEYRKNEAMPIHPKQDVGDIRLIESDIHFEVKENSLQKIGYYYDHRENRKKLISLIGDMKQKYQTGLDLFCYVGAWGMYLLKNGFKSVDFVDQGDFEQTIQNIESKNDFQNEGHFIRKNVFDYLKESNSTYDVVCCDPPAFCKSKKDAHRAYQGYLKLHKLALSKVNNGGLFVASSCTQYIDFEEFNKNVVEASKQLGVELQLLSVGTQGFDHPINNFKSKTSYIKSLIFRVEKNNE